MYASTASISSDDSRSLNGDIFGVFGELPSTIASEPSLTIRRRAQSGWCQVWPLALCRGGDSVMLPPTGPPWQPRQLALYTCSPRRTWRPARMEELTAAGHVAGEPKLSHSPPTSSMTARPTTNPRRTLRPSACRGGGSPLTSEMYLHRRTRRDRNAEQRRLAPTMELVRRRRFLLFAGSALVAACGGAGQSRPGDALVQLYADPAKDEWPEEFRQLPAATQDLYRYAAANHAVLQYIPC